MRSLRLVLTAEDYDEAVRFYRDVLGMPEQMSSDGDDRFVILDAGLATLEIGDPAHADLIDELEVGRRVAGPIRVAFEVSDSAATTEVATGGGARLVAAPTRTPWGSLNARVDAPGGLHVTFFSQDVYVNGGPAPVNGPIALAQPDPGWAATGGRLCAALRETLPEAGVIEHVGSTSVPGLPAKPIIDLLLTVPDPSDEDSYVPRAEGLGYVLRAREPEWYEHRLLRHSDPPANLHVFRDGSPEAARMLAFRDHLRSVPEDRLLYARTKEELAAQDWRTVQDYADAKSEVVRDILHRQASTSQP